MAYANDTNIVTRSKESLKEAPIKLGEVKKKAGLKIKEEKAKIMAQLRRKTSIRQNDKKRR